MVNNLMLTNHKLQKEEARLKQLFQANYKDIISVDIETTGLSPLLDKITCIGIYKPGEAYVLRHENMTQLNTLIGSNDVTGHNFKFDANFIIRNELTSLNYLKQLWKHDSSFLAALSTIKPSEAYIERYEANRKVANKSLPKGFSHRQARGGSLKVLAPYFLEAEPFWEDPSNHNDDTYVILDAMYTYWLTQVLMYQVLINDKADKAYNMLVERAHMLLEAELDGIKLDQDKCKQKIIDTDKKLVELEGELKKFWEPHYAAYIDLQVDELTDKYKIMTEGAFNKTISAKKPKTYEQIKEKYDKLLHLAKDKIEPLNISSPTQLKWLLKQRLGYDITDFDGDEGTGKEILNRLASEGHEDIKVFLEWRAQKKLQSTYYPELLRLAEVDGRIHTSFNLTGARTGRLSSSGPNLQNQPKHLKDLFIPEKGNVLIDYDMSALEPVLIAFFSEDKTLTDLIVSGTSFHSYNAKVMFNLDCDVNKVNELYPKERKAAKEFGLSVLYGAGANRVKQSLLKYGFDFSVDESKKIVYNIRDAYEDVWNFKKELDKIGESGEIIYNYLGRPLLITEKDDIYMTLFNSLIQGSGSDIVMQSATNFCKKYSWAKPRLFVHDSICIEVPEDRKDEACRLLTEEMTCWNIKTTTNPNLKLTVEGGWGYNWKI